MDANIWRQDSWTPKKQSKKPDKIKAIVFSMKSDKDLNIESDYSQSSEEGITAAVMENSDSSTDFSDISD